MFQVNKGPVLSEEVFRLLRDLINRYAGLYFDDNYREIFSIRLRRRLSVLKLDSFMDYYRFLLYDRQGKAEIENLMDILTVNETYFFREPSQFEILIREIIPEFLKKNRFTNKLRFLSAGCSTGEEPYTIAILCDENGFCRKANIEVIGIDISRRVLERARSGVYTESSFRATDNKYRQGYFFPLDNQKYKIKEEVKKLVSFYHGNLLDSQRLSMFGQVEVIFCRNVLIYFDMASRKKVVENFYNILKPGGYLFLGHAESLLNIVTPFQFMYKGRELIYKKPE